MHIDVFLSRFAEKCVFANDVDESCMENRNRQYDLKRKLEVLFSEVSSDEIIGVESEGQVRLG